MKLSPQQLDEIKRREFVRGSAVAVAHHMSVWDDDNLMIAYTDLVRSNIKKQKPDPEKVAEVVAALCERYDIELQGNRELIELVYESTINCGGVDSKS